MRHTIRLAAAVLLASLPAADAHAQEVVEPGQRIRVLAPEYGVTSPTVATVQGMTGDTLVLGLAGGSAPGLPGIEMRLPAGAIRELEISRGPRNRGVTGAVGLGIGAGSGYVAARLHRRFSVRCGSSCGLTGDDLPKYDESTSPKITGAGAVIGLVVGIMLPGESWEPARGIRVSLDDAPARPALGLTLGF